MATFTGRSGVIKVDNSGGGALATLAEVRSFTVDHTMEVIEDTSMGDSARTYKRGLEAATFTAEILYSKQEQPTLPALALGDPAEGVSVEFFPSGAVAAGSKISGEAVLTGYSINSSFDDVVTATVSGTFSGDITFAAGA